MLVLRQALLSETLVASSVDMEDIISRCSKKLFSLLDNVEDAGIVEIIDAICAVSESYNHLLDAEKLQSRKQVMANMLVKSMQAGDAIFTCVSQTVYLAARGAAFGGSGVNGRKLVEAALRRIGASHLADKVMKVAKVLIVVAVISCGVHGDWYQELLKPGPLIDEMH
ncbi:hypothetical protein HS088_TW08G00813 [Tripterygium wilfordii]|uniref:Uncharacterized protein n=1 Tax=Tripterygium wilfordii TaxID=458696 RepID=A0A7J7DCW4_TRIWF|nr:hypothetical protein HS088_TW08G00813 [Tripterygium wilfordii]